MPGIRPLRPDDVPRIAELHLRGFPGERSRPELEDYLARIMFEHPWRNDAMPSLGYEDANGKLVGCLGVMPRPLCLGGRPLQAVVSHNFIVDSEGHPGLAAFALARALKGGCQQLVMGEANAAARTLLERLGWTAIEARSRRWLRVLRPAMLGLRTLERSGFPAGAARHLSPALRFADRGLGRLVGSASARPEPDDVPLDARRLLDLLRGVTAAAPLRPAYDERSLNWILDSLRRTCRPQKLRGGAVRDRGGAMVGWYLYYSRRDGVARVLQLGAHHGFRKLVLQHLFHDAWRSGNVGVAGQTDPAWTGELRASRCLFLETKTCLLVHSRCPAVLEALSAEDTFMSRLETEGWITFAF